MTDIVQPDVVFVSRMRLEIVTRKNIVAAPDLVVEILSESTEKTDRTSKKVLYERHGVKEYWIIDPAEQAVELYQIIEGKFLLALKANGHEVITSKIFPSLSFPASRLFV